MTETVGYWELLRDNRAFRRLFTSRLISLLGDWFNLLALLALLRDIGADSAGAFGGVLILKTLPNVLVSPFAGVWVDRVSRKALLIGTDAIRAVIVCSMLVMLVYPSVPVLYGLIVLQTAVAAFAEPARQALLPDIVRPEELTAANALSAAMWSTMLTFGAALGGLVTAWLGWEAALLVDVLSYVVSALLLVGLVEPERAPRIRSGGFTELVEGFRYMAARPAVWTLALVKMGWSLAGATSLLLAVLAERRYDLAILGVTVLYVARGIGTGLGPVLSRAITASDPRAMERAIGIAYVVGAFFYIGVSQAPHIGLAAVGVTLAHLGGATCWVFSTIRLQQLVPTELRGRVFSAEFAAFTVTAAGSTALYGWLADLPGVHLSTLVAAMGASLLIPAVAWFGRQRWAAAR